MKPTLFCAALTALLLWTTAATNAQSNSPLPPTTTLEITGEQIGSADTEEVAYADLDSDGDGDAFIMALDHNEIWFHQANHQFRKNGQSFGAGLQYDVALGDLDHDGDTDAFIVKQQTATDNAS